MNRGRLGWEEEGRRRNEEVEDENGRIILSDEFLFLAIVWFILIVLVVLISLIMQPNQGVKVVFEGITSRHVTSVKPRL